ncbi:MAG: PIN domain-containing protein [Pedosphaera sp.]|nr:PIN domain-containing protein [Pedosphaera sp.]
MTCLLDVNLLMALLWENHEHHSKIRPWFKGVSAFATCPISQLGFARVSSHPLLGFGMTPDDAFGVLRRLLADPRHRFIPDDLSSADRVVRTDLMTGANQITDRYLIALARQHGCSLATLDEPLAKSFAGEANLVQLVH